MAVFGQNRLYLAKTGCIRAKVVVFWQKWLFSGKIVVIGENWLYSMKVVIIGKKLLYSGKNGCIRDKWF